MLTLHTSSLEDFLLIRLSFEWLSFSLQTLNNLSAYCAVKYLLLLHNCVFWCQFYNLQVLIGFIIPPLPRGAGYTFFIPPLPEGGGGYTVLPLSVRPSVLPSVQDIFRRTFLGNCWWQKFDIWSQLSYRYTMLWVVFLDPSDSYFLFADLVRFYTHWTYMHIFHHIFLSNYWWQKSDIWSQASYRYPISWEAFLDPSDSYFLFADFVDFYTHLTYICICTFFVVFF